MQQVQFGATLATAKLMAVEATTGIVQISLTISVFSLSSTSLQASRELPSAVQELSCHRTFQNSGVFHRSGRQASRDTLVFRAIELLSASGEKRREPLECLEREACL